MKRKFAVLFLVLFSLTFSFPCFAFVLGDVNADNKVDLVEAINALQVTSGVRSIAAGATINVPSTVATIQGAIDAAAHGDTINIAAGTYTETLTIKNKALTIQGSGSGSTIISGTSGADVLTVDAAKGVLISSVTIQGGKNGILAMQGATVELNNKVDPFVKTVFSKS